MTDQNLKIITLSFLGAAFLSAFVARLIFESLAVYVGPVAWAYGHEWLRHALPAGVGFVVFLSLQMRESVRVWANEVVVEVRKVVWPSSTQTMAMTALVCVILMLAGAALGVFDLVGSAVVGFLIDS